MSDHSFSKSSPDLADVFDPVIECLLIVLLAFSPLAFGVVEAWSRLVVLVLIAAMSACLLTKLIVRRANGFVWSWSLLPIILFFGVALFQLAPLPAALLNHFSPQTLNLKSQLLSDAPGADAALRRTTISFYPHATWLQLQLVLAAAAVYVVVLNTYQRAAQVKRLLGAIAIIGAAIAILSLAQNAFGADQIYWMVPVPPALTQMAALLSITATSLSS